ncbi:MAG: response regulator [Alphaproteobacteria bacterium]
MNILIIDDNKVDRMLFRHFAEGNGTPINVVEAKNAKDGLKKIQDNTFECIFLDFMLPNMDGIDLLKSIYNPETELAPYPVVLLTGQGHESIIIDAIKYGAQDYLIKSNLSTDSVMSAIEKARHVFNIKRSQNETKAKLNHSQKIEALGKLTGGIAHDFNNILTIILGNIKLLKDDYALEERNKEKDIQKIEAVQRAAKRGAELVKHLMIFSHQRTLNPRATNINTILNETQSMLKRTINQSIAISLDLADDLWLTDIDPTQFENMIINMCVNARDAMPDGGQLSIQTHTTEITVHEAHNLNLSAGAYIRLTVSDTGAGIPKEIQDNIFDPFFTTKEAGKGTGLGMSMVYGFVKECGGTIQLTSTEKKGTTFDIYFPKSSNTQEAEKDTQKKETLKKGNEIILLVEDEEEIKELAACILEGQGYTILQASNADEALKILVDQSQEIDLLFTDIVMPGEINGVQLVARALDLRPDLKVLFTTGFIKTSIPDMNLLDSYSILDKPYRPDGLIQEVQKILLS